MFDGFYDTSSRVPLDRVYESGVALYPNYNDPICPVPILQGHWEFPALLSLYCEVARKRKPMRVVEIGSLLGGTLWHWIQHAPQGSFITSIDLPLIDEDPRRLQQKDGQDYLWKSWADQKWVNLEVISGNSHDSQVLNQVASHGPIDFLFIDGDHSYEGSKLDFCNYGDLVKSGGIIGLHDILFSQYWTSTEVYKLWEEIKAAGYITQEFYTSRNQIYPVGGAALGIGVIFKK